MTRNIRAALFFSVIALTAIPARAQTPTPGGGKPTIDFLYNQLLALEARVAKVESGRVDASTLVGRYAAQMFGIELAGNPAAVSVETGRFTITLHSNFDVTFSGDDPGVACRLQQGQPWVVSCSSPPDSPESGIKWRIDNGMLVFSEHGVDFSAAPIGAGGRFFSFGEAHQESAPGPSHTASWSNIVIAIRLPD